jgi:hypothetical protein
LYDLQAADAVGCAQRGGLIAMPWAALDDGYHEDPRILEAGLAAAGLYACATTYIARHLTDGFITRRALHRLLDEDGDAEPLSALLRVGLLREDGNRFEVVDYFKDGRNKTRAEVEDLRAKRKARARKAAASRWGHRNCDDGDNDGFGAF